MRDRRNKDTIIFDMDGVVIDSGRTWIEANTKLIESRGGKFKHDEIRPLMAGKASMDAMRAIKKHYGFEDDPQAMHEERTKYVRELFASEVSYIEGIEDFINLVKQKGYKIALATACEPDLLIIVDEALGISKHFGEHMYKIADVGFKSKPDPAVFLYAAEKLDSRPEDCYVIEDSPLGVKAAKNAQMFAIGYVDTFKVSMLEDEGADLIVENFRVLEKWLEI